jgi:hypothetical protein
MSLCTTSPEYHRWDAQKALAKGGVDDGDLCDCGAVAFGLTRDQTDFRRKYHEAMEILTRWENLDHAHAVAKLIEAEKEIARLKKLLAEGPGMWPIQAEP